MNDRTRLMPKALLGRRTFLTGASATVVATGALRPGHGSAQQGAAGGAAGGAGGVPLAVPNSAGSAAPRITAPAGACDCHHHIYDSVPRQYGRDG